MEPVAVRRVYYFCCRRAAALHPPHSSRTAKRLKLRTLTFICDLEPIQMIAYAVMISAVLCWKTSLDGENSWYHLLLNIFSLLILPHNGVADRIMRDCER